MVSLVAASRHYLPPTSMVVLAVIGLLVCVVIMFPQVRRRAAPARERIWGSTPGGRVFLRGGRIAAYLGFLGCGLLIATRIAGGTGSKGSLWWVIEGVCIGGLFLGAVVLVISSLFNRPGWAVDPEYRNQPGYLEERFKFGRAKE